MKRTFTPHRTITRGRTAVAALLLGACVATPAAELWYEAGAVDKSEWECKYCLFDQGLDGELQVGVGYVDDSEFPFGNYTGYDEDGAFPVLGADLRYRGEDAAYWRFNASRLALDSRRADFEGGRQGYYRVTVDYVEIPRLHTDAARTPFRGVGGTDLRLPASWVEAGTTDAMVGLDDSLHSVELRTDRQRLGVGFDFTPASRWHYSADFRRDRKEGVNVIGGSVLFRGVLLPEPVEYTTDRIDLAVAYQADRGNIKLAYLGSFFRNDNASLRWDNPFTDPVGHANEGQMALPPDNEFHQLMLSGNYDLGEATRAIATLAIGRMTQNDDFLPYTVNPSLVTTPLPRQSLDGEVRTTTFDLRVVSTAVERLTLQADLRYHERDDQTPTDTYDFVSTDAFLPGARENRHYDRRDSRLGLQGRYRLTADTRMSAGIDHERKERPGQEVEETRETTLWAEAASRLHPTTDLTVSVARADRDASSYRVLATTTPAQNPLLVKFNMAARKQERAGARLNFSPREHLDFGLDVSYRENDYTDTAIGLRASRDTVLTLDATLVAGWGVGIHAFATRERHENEQAGSRNFTVPDWFATQEDRVDSAGVGVTWDRPDNRLALSVDYVRSEATGRISLDEEPDFPDLKTWLTSITAKAGYRLSETLSTELAYFYERYESDDWQVDGVEPDSLPTVLTLGDYSTEYDNHVTAVYVRYRF